MTTEQQASPALRDARRALRNALSAAGLMSSRTPCAFYAPFALYHFDAIALAQKIMDAARLCRELEIDNANREGA